MAKSIDRGWAKRDDPMFSEGFRVFTVRKSTSPGEGAKISTPQTPAAGVNPVPAQSATERHKRPISGEEFERQHIIANGGNPLSEQQRMEMNIQYCDLLDKWGDDVVADIQGRSEPSRQTGTNDEDP